MVIIVYGSHKLRVRNDFDATGPFTHLHTGDFKCSRPDSSLPCPVLSLVDWRELRVSWGRRAKGADLHEASDPSVLLDMWTDSHRLAAPGL